MRPSKDPESRDDRASTYIKTKTEPETGAVLMKALDAAREALYRQTKNVSAGTLNDVAAEPPAFSQRQADALALLAETVLHHGIDPGPPGERYQVVVRRCPGPGRNRRAGRPRRPRTVRPRGRRPRFRRDVPAAGVRRDPRRDAPRRGRPGDRGRRPDPHHSAGAPAGPPASGPQLPLPRLRPLVRPRAPHSPLGARRPDDAVKSRVAVSPPSPHSPRGRLPDRTTAGWRAVLQAARRPATAAGAAAGNGASRSRCGNQSAERCASPSRRRASI